MAPRNEERRREILASTYSLLDEASYDRVSLNDIARGAGIKKSLLQRYFPQQDEEPEKDLFQRISNFNMLFFAAVAEDYRMYQFILATVASPEILDVWIDTICNWLRRYIQSRQFNMLDLRCALCFAMGGSMHLFQHQEELGIDYTFFCEKHIRAILEFLNYSAEEIDVICNETEEWIERTDVGSFLEYCRNEIDWIEERDEKIPASF